MNGKMNIKFRSVVTCTERRWGKGLQRSSQWASPMLLKFWGVKCWNMIVLSIKFLAVCYPLYSLLYIWNISQLKIKRNICYLSFPLVSKMFFTSLEGLSSSWPSRWGGLNRIWQHRIFTQLVDVLTKEW